MVNIKHNARKRLANNILYFRLKNGWTQADLAEKLNSSSAYISQLENAKRNTRIDYIDHIATTLDVELFQLFEKRDNIENRRIPRR